MCPIDDLSCALAMDPANPILAAMLAAELVERRGMLHTEAARHVERITTTTRSSPTAAARSGPATSSSCPTTTTRSSRKSA